MEQTVSNKVFSIELDKKDSTFIKSINYNVENKVLSVGLNYGIRNYENVPMEVFVDFSTATSFGNFYNSNIKNKFKMARKQTAPQPAQNNSNKPRGINQASDKARWIDIDVNLSKIDSRFIVIGKKSGDKFLKLKLRMLPDGEVDQYENLGFVSQTVPTDMYKKDNKLQGPILGNARENQWAAHEQEETRTASSDDGDIMDDLPF